MVDRSVFAGRVDELGTLERALDRARAGSPTTVLVGGITERGDRQSRCDAVSEIKAALTTLGIVDNAPAPGSALAAHLAMSHNDALLPPVVE